MSSTHAIPSSHNYHSRSRFVFCVSSLIQSATHNPPLPHLLVYTQPGKWPHLCGGELLGPAFLLGPEFLVVRLGVDFELLEVGVDDFLAAVGALLVVSC